LEKVEKMTGLEMVLFGLPLGLICSSFWRTDVKNDRIRNGDDQVRSTYHIITCTNNMYIKVEFKYSKLNQNIKNIQKFKRICPSAIF